MAKFVIKCPECKKYAQADTGLFGLGWWVLGGSNEVKCSCGHIIDVKTETMTSRECPHCGNNVVFDQKDGANAKCPVCGEPINTMEEQSKTVQFSCEQCGIRLNSSKGAATYKCPVCNHINHVAERVMNEELKRSGLASVIKYEGDGETLAWKHPIEDFCLGSQLIVHESQEAVFFRDGQALDLFGAGRYTLETQRLPELDKLYNLPMNTDGMFHSEVYFVNTSVLMGIKWGTDSKVRLFDPATGLHIELGASGEFNLKISNSRKFLLKVVGTTGKFTTNHLIGIRRQAAKDDLNRMKEANVGTKGFFRAMMMTHVKSFLASVIKENNINILEIDEQLMFLSEALRDKIRPYFEEYGLDIVEFYISRVVTPDNDPNFKKMKDQHAEQYLLVRAEQIKKKEAEAAADRKAAEARMKIIDAQGDAEILRIQKAAEADAYRMKSAAEAEEMKMKGYTYQQETVRQVGLEAMQNGITGNGEFGGGLGEIAGLGLSFGAMESIINMTKTALNPVVETVQPNLVKSKDERKSWDCVVCGKTGISANYCDECGTKRPEIKQRDSWGCPKCGNKGITAKFCGECGTKRPEIKMEAVWDCPVCGNKAITEKFCGECGTKRPFVSKSWDCPGCGNKGITGKFCTECGKKRDEE